MRGVAVGLAFAVLVGLDATAQPPVRPGGLRDGGRAGSQGGGPPRGLLEERLRERLEAAIRQQLGLSDAQADRLHALNLRLDERRRTLLDDERAARVALRRAMYPADSADQAGVAEALDRIVRVHRERASLLETEQRELAQFLTPLQRARYLGMQEQFRRRVEELREREGDRGAPPPALRPGAPGRRPFAGRIPPRDLIEE